MEKSTPPISSCKRNEIKRDKKRHGSSRRFVLHSCHSNQQINLRLKPFCMYLQHDYKFWAIARPKFASEIWKSHSYFDSDSSIIKILSTSSTWLTPILPGYPISLPVFLWFESKCSVFRANESSVTGCMRPGETFLIRNDKNIAAGFVYTNTRQCFMIFEPDIAWP